jgi:hypothetical protein
MLSLLALLNPMSLLVMLPYDMAALTSHKKHSITSVNINKIRNEEKRGKILAHNEQNWQNIVEKPL